MLIGKNIVLRPLKIEDLPKTHQWRNNLELIKLTQGIRFPKTIEMEKDWFNQILNDKSNKNIYFGIDEIQSGEFIGMVQLNQIDYISGTAFWGITIGENNKQKKGYGYEALRLLFNYSFGFLNLKKVTSYSIEYNDATYNLQKKLGFIEEGRLKKHVYFDGKYHDVIILSLFKENFKNES